MKTISQISFKDITTRIDKTSYDNGQENKHLTYEEYVNVIKEINKPPSKTKIQIDTAEFLNENSELLFDILNHLKMKHESNGFLNNMSLEDFYKILEKHIWVEEIIDRDEENEFSLEDDDF